MVYPKIGLNTNVRPMSHVGPPFQSPKHFVGDDITPTKSITLRRDRSSKTCVGNDVRSSFTV